MWNLNARFSSDGFFPAVMEHNEQNEFDLVGGDGDACVEFLHIHMYWNSRL